jgi:hypothetical protein
MPPRGLFRVSRARPSLARIGLVHGIAILLLSAILAVPAAAATNPEAGGEKGKTPQLQEPGKLHPQLPKSVEVESNESAPAVEPVKLDGPSIPEGLPEISGEAQPPSMIAEADLVPTDAGDLGLRIPPALASGFIAGQSKEIKTERTPSTKMFANPDGSKSAKVYGSAIHYTDAKGILQEIDTSLVTTDRG